MDMDPNIMIVYVSKIVAGEEISLDTLMKTRKGAKFDDDGIVDESFNNDEFKRYLAAAEKLGLKTAGDLMNFSKEHGNVQDQELLKALEDAAAEVKEPLTEDILTEAPFDGRKRIIKFFRDKGIKYVIKTPEEKFTNEVDSYDKAEAWVKSQSAQVDGAFTIIAKANPDADIKVLNQDVPMSI
jgi:hypothetical protein